MQRSFIIFVILERVMSILQYRLRIMTACPIIIIIYNQHVLITTVNYYYDKCSAGGGGNQLQCWGLWVALKSLVNLCNVFPLLDYLLIIITMLFQSFREIW